MVTRALLYVDRIAYEVCEEINSAVVRIIVTCPEDYDGTVFQIGYADLSIVSYSVS